MKRATSLCPASLSFIFKVCPNENLVKMGSVGIGCTIDKNVKVKVEFSSSPKIFFNKKLINLTPVYFVVSKLTSLPIKVSIESPLPLGYGFGISGASSLACAFALNKLLKLKKSRLTLTSIAHLAEIENHTGLGTVATQVTGGFLLKNQPGIPVKNFIRLPFANRKLYAVMIDKWETPSILTNQSLIKKINQAADSAIRKIKKIKNITLEEIINISYQYVLDSELIKNDKQLLLIIDKIRKETPATLAMLGAVIITTKKPKKINNYPIKELTIMEKNAKIYE